MSSRLRGHPSGMAADQMPTPVDQSVLDEVLVFVRDRLYGWLRDQGLAHEAVAAALAESAADPSRAAVTARGLAALTARTEWPEVLTAYARCKRIVRNLVERYPVAPEYYTEQATYGLYQAWEGAMARLQQPGGSTVEVLGQVLVDLQVPITRFFTDVLVMADDPVVRQARLALVQRVAALPDGIADLSLLQGF